MNTFQKQQAAKLLSCYTTPEEIQKSLDDLDIEKAHPVGYINKNGFQKQADGKYKYVGKGKATAKQEPKPESNPELDAHEEHFENKRKALHESHSKEVNAHYEKMNAESLHHQKLYNDAMKENKSNEELKKLNDAHNESHLKNQEDLKTLHNRHDGERSALIKEYGEARRKAKEGSKPKDEESKTTKSLVDAKDWDRMIDLVTQDKEGNPSSIKDKKKAIARYVAGLKLTGNVELKESDKWSWDAFGNHDFREFGNHAIKLGATKEEIQEAFAATEVPKEVKEKFERLNSKSKGLGSWVTNSLSKTLLNAGYDVEFSKQGGSAKTLLGKDAMRGNGRNWTMHYEGVITTPGGKKVNVAFDAITDEGQTRPTKFVLDHINNSDPDHSLDSFNAHGVGEFTKRLMSVIKD